MRAISVVVVLEAAGRVFFVHGLQLNNGKHAESIARGALILAVAAALLTIFQHVVAPARLAASFAGIFDSSLQDFYLRSDAGVAHGIRTGGMLALIIGLTTKSRWLAICGAVIACLSFTAMGHTITHSPRWVLFLLLSLHILLVAFWFGSLRPLRRTVDDDYVIAAECLEGFSQIASRIVPFILVAGIGLAVLMLGSFERLITPYGFLIIAKTTGFAFLIGLACFNRWRLLPQIRSGQSSAIAAFQRIARTEWLIIVLMIVATVSVTSLFSP